MDKLPRYERNRRIQELCQLLEQRGYAIWFRTRSRIFMISGRSFNEREGLLYIHQLLNTQVAGTK